MPKISKNKGSTPIVWGEFFDPITNLPLDPIDLTLDVKSPDSTIDSFIYGVDAEIVRDSEGVFNYRLHLDQEGTYHWRWTAGGGPGEGATVVGELDSVESTNFEVIP